MRGLHRDGDRRHAFCSTTNGNLTSRRGATNQHTIDTTLNRKTHLANVVVEGRRFLRTIEQSALAYYWLIVSGFEFRAFVRPRPLWRGNAAQPLDLTPIVEMNHTIVERATTSLLVNDFNFDNGHICPIGLEAIGILNRSELQVVRFTCGFNRITADLPALPIADSLERTSLEGDIGKRKQILITAHALAQ